MKLLLITSTYPTPNAPHQGVFNGQMVAALSRLHAVRVIAPIPWTSNPLWKKNSPSRKSMGNTKNVIHPTFYYPPSILRWTYGFWYWLSIRKSLLHLTADFRPDAILGYWAHPDSEAAVRAARLFKVPAVVMVGGSDIRILAKTGRRRKVIQSVLTQANRVIAFSADLARHVVDLGVPSDRVDVVYRGVDHNIFKSRDRSEARKSLGIDGESIVLVWVGRLVDVKNPGMAIQATAKWKQLYGDRFRLVMIGDGVLKSGLERLADQLGTRQNISFLGSIPHAQIASWFQAANLTILTSHSEGVPNVLLESIACGTPFVATDVGGVREIADPHSDHLIAAGDEAALEAVVAAKLADTNVYQRERSTNDVHALASRITEILERT